MICIDDSFQRLYLILVLRDSWLMYDLYIMSPITLVTVSQYSTEYV